MDKRGWEPAELARRAGMQQNRMHHYATGGGTSISNARKLAEVLGVSVLKVLFEAGELTAEELGERVVTGDSVTLADIPTRDLLAELDRRHGGGEKDARQVM